VHNQKAHIEQLIISERDLAGQLGRKKAHIEQLIISERDLKGTLQAVYASRSWRLTSGVRKASTLLIPYNSKRRMSLSLIKFAVRHPFRFLRKLTPRKIASFFKILRTDGATGVTNRLYGRKQPERSAIEVFMPAASYDILEFISQPHPKVSIIIPVYNQFDVTYNCLRALLKNTHGVPYEIIVADDCSSDLTANMESIIKNVHKVTTHANMRFLKNCNNAAQHANGEYIVLLNNDTQVQDNWLLPLVELMDNDGRTGVAGAKLLNPDGTLQEAGGILWDDGSAWNYGRGADPDRAEYNYVREVDYVSGAALMVRKSLWDELQGFDTLFSPAYCEDSDLCFSARSMGYKVLYQPKSVVVHFEGLSHGTDTSSGLKQHQVENQKKI
jgi:GT2 family glycosyltransferase